MFRGPQRVCGGLWGGLVLIWGGRPSCQIPRVWLPGGWGAPRDPDVNTDARVGAPWERVHWKAPHLRSSPLLLPMPGHSPGWGRSHHTLNPLGPLRGSCRSCWE